MKLEVGMYVRTNYGISRITKVLEECESCIVDKAIEGLKIVLKEDITKARHNIIDLIEENDIIEYAPIHNGYEKKQLFCRRIKDAKDLICFKYQVEHNKAKIKSIVTKEQFECMKYSLEG